MRDESLPKQVVELLIKNGLTISSAESCTGGLFAKLITDIPGSSAVLNESYVTYANSAKTKNLGVREDTLKQFGAVSEQTVIEMADGLYKISNADVCVVFSGIAGPDGGTLEKPVGTVFSAICFKGKTTAYKLHFDGDRNNVRMSACYEMFDKIKNLLLF